MRLLYTHQRRHPHKKYEIKIEGRLSLDGALPRRLQPLLRHDDYFNKRIDAPFFLGGGVYYGVPVFFEMAFIFHKHGRHKT